MKLEAVLADLISEVVKEQGLSTVLSPMSDELQRFTEALMKKARGRDAPIPITGNGKAP